MKQGIPDTIKLFKFATKSLIFTQTYQVSDFPRVSALVSNLEASVEVELSFDLAPHKIPCIKGKIELDLVLCCQRCLDGVSIHLQPTFQLAFLQNEQQATGLDSGFETMLNTNDEFSSIEFITDEILIAIPMIPMHSHNCASYKNTQAINEQKRENPFAMLKNKKQGVKNGCSKK